MHWLINGYVFVAPVEIRHEKSFCWIICEFDGDGLDAIIDCIGSLEGQESSRCLHSTHLRGICCPRA